jgi:hypothetical protein
MTTGHQATVRIRDAGAPQRADTSDARFTIAPNPLTGAPTILSPALALGRVFPNPARDELFVSFTLPDAEPALLELVDVAGRRVAGRAVGAMGPGSHVVGLGHGLSLESGLYFVRLRRGAQSQTTRVAIVE